MHNTRLMHILVVLTVALLLGACSAPPQPAPQELHATVQPGGVYRFTPAPVVGTPEPNPTLTLKIAILDAATGRPVRGDVLVGGSILRRGVDHVEITLPGRATGITVTVQTPGYAPWSQTLSYKLDHSRLLSLRAELTPAPTLPTSPVGQPVLSEVEGGRGGGSQPPTDTPDSVLVLPTSASVPVASPPTDTAFPTAALPPPVSPILPTPPTPTPSSTPTPVLSATLSPPKGTVEGPSDPSAWWSWPCNVCCPHYPDGCPEFARWDRPPDSPITPPCIRLAYTEPALDDCEGEEGVRVVVILDHPEDPCYSYPDSFATQEVHVTRCGAEPAPSDALSADTQCPSSKGGAEGERWWTDVGPNWGYDCHFNPAPLAWAVTEALNTRSLAPFDAAYDASLPAPFVDFIAGLIEATPTPSLTPTSPHTPTPVDSPLLTPPP